MRPLKITITAFGPYKNTEVIDFTELKDNRLFVVSGNTGAGKTTIFDAICFALYGTASGEDRNDSKLMRSDFADDDVHTSVDLEFELHDKYYRILRQLPHVKQGNKGATGERYEFYEKVNGREIPCVDRQIVSEINKRVEELVGLTKDQFSQIVMLPQGEFRKLLTSQTENKEEILRKIFKTEPYKWISERLKDKKKAAEVDYNREAEMRERYINDINAILPVREASQIHGVLTQEQFNTNQVIAGLEAEAAFYTNEIVKNKKQAEDADQAYNRKLSEYHQAKALNDRFQELEEKEKRLTVLNGQVPIFTDKEQQLENAEKASGIEVYENQVNEWRQDVKVKTQAFATVEVALKVAGEQLAKAKKEYEKEENKKLEREELARNLDRLLGFLPTVKEIDSKKLEISQMENNVGKLVRNLTAVQEKIGAEKTAKDKLSTEIKGIEQAVEHLSEKQLQLSEMREQVKVLKDFLGLTQKQAQFELDLQEKEESYKNVKVQYQKLEDAWVSGQASILAAHLHDGKPCPVCGSSEHPNKAQGQDAVPTKEELEAAKRELDTKEGAFREAAAVLRTNTEQLKTKTEELAEFGVQVKDAKLAFDKLVEAGQELASQVKLLGKEKERLAELRGNFGKLEQQLADYESQKDKLSKAYQEQNTDLEKKKAIYDERIKPIPEEIRILAVLEQKISETERMKVQLEQAWEAAQKHLQQAKDEETKAVANVANAKTQLEESISKKERAEKQFLDALVQADFLTEDAYRNAKMPEATRKQLKEEIADFNKNLETLKQQVRELQDLLKDQTKVDLLELAEALEQLKQTYDQAIDILRQTEQFQQKAEELKTKILDADKNVADFEKQLSMITDLFDVVRGQNSSKISFERYLQIEYLEQIIIAANERLKRLSNGQFLLIRSDRQESRGKQSGLGLDVYDAYTGQTRDVKTMSGGEKFNASLCLALGMADVIQSFQGGVSIDTMFIDEGFGSLDEESLNKSIDTLIDLQQSGRMIGVISHVQEMKNVIPAILEVKKSKEGYSQTQFIIK